MKKLRLAGTLFASTLVLVGTGCHSLQGYPDRTIKASTELKHLQRYFSDDVLQSYNSIDDSTAAGKSKRRAYRDEVVNGRLRAIDLQFEIFERAINHERNLTQIGTDWAVLGLSGGGTIIGGATSKAILHAISGGLTAAKLSIDKTLYYEKTMPALLAQMQAMRTQQLVNIRTAQQQSAEQYPLSQALADVDTYYRAGTLPGAIIGINSAAGARTEAANEQLGQILKGTFQKDSATDLLRKFWKPDGTNIDSANQAKLKEWMQDHGFDPDAIVLFLNSKETADARLKAVKDLGLAP